MCLCIVDIIYARRQYHQCYTLIKCENLFYKSNIYKLQLHSPRLCSSIEFRTIYKPIKIYILLVMCPSKKDMIWLQLQHSRIY